MSEQYWSDEDVISYLKKLRVAIDQGLRNLGEDPDDEVSGFAFERSSPAVGLAQPAAAPRTPAFRLPRSAEARERTTGTAASSAALTRTSGAADPVRGRAMAAGPA